MSTILSSTSASSSATTVTSCEVSQQEPVFQTGSGCLRPLFKLGRRAPRTLGLKAEDEKAVMARTGVVAIEIVEQCRGEVTIKDLLNSVPVTRKGGVLRDLRATIKITLRTKGEDFHERLDILKITAKKNKAMKKVIAFADKQKRKAMCPRFKEKRNTKFWTVEEHMDFEVALAEWYRMGDEFRAQQKKKKKAARRRQEDECQAQDSTQIIREFAEPGSTNGTESSIVGKEAGRRLESAGETKVKPSEDVLPPSLDSGHGVSNMAGGKYNQHIARSLSTPVIVNLVPKLFKLE
ncbi:hypothetical protein G7K_2264-t1 [Saitoella complicata NRRL Y-17804]|uniref:Uncharacterized protein n=1 Tax=Saitoella complicata (strain BCRC 22490 / CBS 7301 / JCM 7358 / NBRC 10748 / NRRL Y-17804) TaxID=698492 RepID=A0A0E9NDZ8_SAICN|nr:hypothetical protein G7K_2264-t1 [Saitoella complicata NRRL Y-17804]